MDIQNSQDFPYAKLKYQTHMIYVLHICACTQYIWNSNFRVHTCTCITELYYYTAIALPQARTWISNVIHLYVVVLMFRELR